jgi:hypothetical protein
MGRLVYSHKTSLTLGWIPSCDWTSASPAASRPVPCSCDTGPEGVTPRRAGSVTERTVR